MKKSSAVFVMVSLLFFSTGAVPVFSEEKQGDLEKGGKVYNGTQNLNQ